MRIKFLNPFYAIKLTLKRIFIHKFTYFKPIEGGRYDHSRAYKGYVILKLVAIYTDKSYLGSEKW